MPHNRSHKADHFRRRAQTCAVFAEYAKSQADTAHLARMRDAYLALAANEDWLDSLPPLPPANAGALAVAH